MPRYSPLLLQNMLLDNIMNEIYFDDRRKWIEL